jgi:hypothetical protein
VKIGKDDPPQWRLNLGNTVSRSEVEISVYQFFGASVLGAVASRPWRELEGSDTALQQIFQHIINAESEDGSHHNKAQHPEEAVLRHGFVRANGVGYKNRPPLNQTERIALAFIFDGNDQRS